VAPDRAARIRQAAAGVAGVVAASAALVIGMLILVPQTADFFTQVLPHIGGGTTSYENKSFPALVGRVTEWVGFLNPGSGVGAIDSKLVTLVGLAVFILPLLWMTARRVAAPGRERAARAAGLAAYVAAMPIVSTITWRHHLVVSILAMALLLPALWPLAGIGASRAARWLLVASYPLTYIPQDAAHALALGPQGRVDPTLFNAVKVLLLEDLNLFGMVCLWLACLLALRGLLVSARAALSAPRPRLPTPPWRAPNWPA
jgi:hypothetical protein